MHWLTYCLEEAVASMWRQRGGTVLAVATIAAAMAIVGGFLLITENVGRLVSRWSAAAEVSIYLQDAISDDERMSLNRILAESPIVASREYVSRAEALVRFKRDFPDLAGGMEGLERNPLPASIEIRLRPQAAQGAAVDGLVRQVTALRGVADVRFDRRWLERLGAIVAAVRWAGWILSGVLMLAAVLTVATVVRLTLHARRDEIDIMQLMGAPLGLLRGPFVTEGLLQGGCGAAIALGLLFAGVRLVRLRYAADLAGLVDAGVMDFLSPLASTLLLVGGMAVGCLGGLAAARRVR
jgi:cell division transport system permease protein